MAEVPQAVIDAILAGTTAVTRRAEIYEADGVTPFLLTPKVKDGSVSVDYSRTDRRNFDLVLDNTDGSIVHDPDNGLWYDKVIKCYRGLNYTNTKKIPSIAVIGQDSSTTSPLVGAFRRAGFNNFTFFPSTPSLGDLVDCDIIAAWSIGADFTASVANLLNDAFNSGKYILTNSNSATEITVPLIGSSVHRSQTSNWDINIPVGDNPFSGQFVPYNAPWSAVDTIPTTASSIARVVATTSYSAGGQVPSALMGTDNSGGRWFHYHPQASVTLPTAPDVTAFVQLLVAGVRWLYSYGSETKWEVQIGEFMIDKISEPRFPHQIAISGRDYCKRLALSRYSNAVTYTAGTNIDYLVRAIAVNGGIPYNKLQLGGGNAALMGDVSFSRGSDRLSAIVILCNNANLEVFFNAYGYLITRPFLDPAIAPIALALNLGPPFGNLVSLTKSSDDSMLFNRVIVTGGSSSSAVQDMVYEGIAENHSPTSPTRIERIGERTMPEVQMPSFTSDDQCIAFAQKLLSVSALESYNLDYASLVFPWVEAGEIAQFTDNLNVKDPVRYLMTSFTIPMGLTTMNGSVKRVTVVG